MRPFHKVLLIEDDTGFTESVARVFAAYNIELDTAPDGRVGLLRVRDRMYDLIITDLNMPVIGGFDFVEEAGARLAQVPMMIMTASGQKKDVIRARELQIMDYLVKPVRPSHLIARMQEKLPNPPGLVLLSGFPESIRYKSLGSQGVAVHITGCPGPDFSKHAAAVAADIQAHLATVPRIELTVEKEFAYAPGAHHLLEQATAVIAKRVKVSGAKIQLLGEYWTIAPDCVPDPKIGIFAQAVWP